MYDGTPETIRALFHEMLMEIHMETLDWSLASWISSRLKLKGVCAPDIDFPEGGIDITNQKMTLVVSGYKVVLQGKPIRLVPDPEEVTEAVKELVTRASAAVPIIKPDAPLRWYKNDKVRDELKRAIARVNDLLY